MPEFQQRIFSFDDFVMEERRKYLVVAIYDVIDSSRRTRLANFYADSESAYRNLRSNASFLMRFISA